MTWLKIIQLLLSVAANLSDFVRDRQLLNAGEQVGASKSLARITHNLGLDAEVEREMTALSDKAARDRLKEDMLP